MADMEGNEEADVTVAVVKRRHSVTDDSSSEQPTCMMKKLKENSDMKLSLKCDEDSCDVKIIIGENELHAHKWVLSLESKYFNSTQTGLKQKYRHWSRGADEIDFIYYF